MLEYALNLSLAHPRHTCAPIVWCITGCRWYAQNGGLEIGQFDYVNNWFPVSVQYSDVEYCMVPHSTMSCRRTVCLPPSTCRLPLYSDALTCDDDSFCQRKLHRARVNQVIDHLLCTLLHSAVLYRILRVTTVLYCTCTKLLVRPSDCVCRTSARPIRSARATTT